MTQEQNKIVGFGGTFVGVGMMVKLQPSAGMFTGRRCMVEVLNISNSGYCGVRIITVWKNRAGWKAGDQALVFIGHLEGV